MIDDLALVIGDVVIFEQVLANIEVMRLDLSLSAFDLARENLALDCLTFTHAGARQQVLGALRITEDAHQGVFH